jgi:ABC-2 type transport system ATP-binding protein
MDKTSEPAIIVRDLHKDFILPQHKNTSVKQTIVNITRKNKKTTQHVLDGVSFEVNKGDFFGIVGRNGSGKSTLLKILAGVYTPTSGSVEIRGGLTPFIELGVGFNPELSGRDNVFLNGALLGFNRSEMTAMYDDIVAFAELENFMDQKLKNYSSGMQVRLAFSIAIMAKNDILIFDEVLAVGDEAFQRKCLDTFDKYKATGQTVILVTHSMETVRQYCNKAILINKGNIVSSGDPNKVADVYNALNQEAIDSNNEKKNKLAQNHTNFKVSLRNNEKDANSFAVGEKAKVEIRWDQSLEVEAVWVDLYKKSGEHICNFISKRDGSLSLRGKNAASVDIDLNISPGGYYIDVGLWDAELKNRLAALYPACELTVTKDWTKTDHKFGGLVWLSSKWD